MNLCTLVVLFCLVVIGHGDRTNKLIEGDDCRRKLDEIGWRGRVSYISGVGCVITIDNLMFHPSSLLAASMEELDTEVTIFLEWHLDMIDGGINDRFNLPDTGENIDVYVLDTGVSTNHQEFDNGQCIEGTSIVNEFPTSDNNGHGTHVSSLVAGHSVGVAPNCTVIGVKVLSSTGSGSMSNVIEGLAWALDYAENNRSAKGNVISMSLGGGFSKILNRAVEEISKDPKWVVVVAAGNSDADSTYYSPASAGENVVTVGANDMYYKKASFSNWGGPVDIFSPGVFINGAYLNNQYRKLSGTSMSTPLVAGLIAALFSMEENTNSEDVLTHMYSMAMNKIMFDEEKYYDTTSLVVQYNIPPPPSGTPTQSPIPKLRKSICTTIDVRNKRAIKSLNRCTENYAMSQFGPREADFIQKEFVYINNYFCSDSDVMENIRDHVVMVDRGECLFFDKVKLAQKHGAAAVLFRNHKGSQMIRPNYQGDDADTITIQSAMVGYYDVKELNAMPRKLRKKKTVSQICFWGYGQYTEGFMTDNTM